MFYFFSQISPQQEMLRKRQWIEEERLAKAEYDIQLKNGVKPWEAELGKSSVC